MPSEEIEEYLETIYNIAGKNGVAKTTEIAEHRKITPASVTEVLQRIARKGLVHYLPYQGASLTKKGVRIVTGIKRRHRLLEVFLSKVLGIKRENIHREACKMEHTLSTETADALCRLLGAPEVCPHGSPITPCEKNVRNCAECEIADKRKKIAEEELVPVSELKPGNRGKITFIRGGRKVVQRLVDLGLTPGTVISVVRTAPLNGPIEIRVRDSNLVIGRGIGKNIFLHK